MSVLSPSCMPGSLAEGKNVVDTDIRVGVSFMDEGSGEVVHVCHEELVNSELTMAAKVKKVVTNVDQ